MPSLPDVIILCGGAGTRLRSVTGDVPKGMANVAGRPFLELLRDRLHHRFGDEVGIGTDLPAVGDDEISL